MLNQTDEPVQIAADVEAVGRLAAVPPLLKLLCESTGMGFAAIARVTDRTWTACAVRDEIAFGLGPGGQLDVATTLCSEVRANRTVIYINQASSDPVYSTHHTPKIYGLESYISVPILLTDGTYFGNLCAIDPRPAKLDLKQLVPMFSLFAELVGSQVYTELLRDKDRAALREEQTLGELREQFIAILGHDLRNPLAAIDMGASFLQERSTDPELIEVAARVRSSSRRMTGLIEQVLDFTRARHGGGLGVEIARERDLQGALLVVVDELRDSHPARDIRVDIPPLPLVHCDVGRIQQLTSNLLANALAYGYSGYPVEVTAAAPDGELHLRVSNHGDPIPAGVIDRIFSPFWRRSADVHREGLGLGLHICSEIVRGHGGSIEVTSTAEEGTSFLVRLPLAAPRAQVDAA